MTTWGDKARAVIAEVHAQLPADATLKQRKRAVDAAYPFGSRTLWPYKAWCAARREYLGKYGYKKPGQRHPAVPVAGVSAPNWAAYVAWLKTRPECVQKLAAEFPPMTLVGTPDGPMVVIGYNESDMLIVAPGNPLADKASYREARERQQLVCAAHLRNGDIPYRKSEWRGAP